MMSPENLQFDKMNVDTKKAQKYFEECNFTFRGFGFAQKDEDEEIVDAANNKIYCSDLTIKTTPPEHETGLEYCVQLNTLAIHLQAQVNLLCQLEYLIRKKPIQTTKLELEMIIKHLQYRASPTTHKLDSRPLVMKNDSPLIDLGYIALWNPAAGILATENMAAVCQLFSEICRSAGFKSIKLGFVRNDDPILDKQSSITDNKALYFACIGVVTTQSDVESAVNAFLSAPEGDLWGIRRILVQESASERFLTELAWKTQSASQADVDPKLKSQCTDVYVHGSKIFLQEYVGSDDGPKTVPIESFRTVKELLTLIEAHSPFCVSLWSHGLAESNEIAFAVTAPMVWVNRYGQLGDPYEVSLAYYSPTFLNIENRPEMDNVRKLQKIWSKLTLAERRTRATKTYMMIVTQKLLKLGREFEFYVHCMLESNRHVQSFIKIGDGDVVIGIRKPRDLYAIQWTESCDNAADVINHLIQGSGFLINIPDGVDDKFKMFATWLAEAGFPIQLGQFEFPPDKFPLASSTRIIHSSYGTIFAN